MGLGSTTPAVYTACQMFSRFTRRVISWTWNFLRPNESSSFGRKSGWASYMRIYYPESRWHNLSLTWCIIDHHISCLLGQMDFHLTMQSPWSRPEPSVWSEAVCAHTGSWSPPSGWTSQKKTCRGQAKIHVPSVCLIKKPLYVWCL